MKIPMETETILVPKEVEPSQSVFRVRGVFNPAGVRLGNGKILLMARVAETPYHDKKTFVAPRFSGNGELKWTIERIDRKRMKICPDCFLMDEELSRLPTISHFRKIWLDKTGFRVDDVSQSPDFFGVKDDGDFGVEDPRITYFGKEKKYAMTYVSVSMDSGVSTSLAVSRDLKNWRREGVIFRQQNKDVVIFPEKINGYYVALHRPDGTMIFDKPSIWISYSKDLIYWGRDKPIIKPRKFGWDSLKIGAGAVPVKTKEGWLEIYHGVALERLDDQESKKIYTAGAFLMDEKHPHKVVARTPAQEPLFKATLKVEKGGFTNKVVFPTAALTDRGGKHLLIYSGAADSAITVRKIRVKDILNSLS